MAGLLDAYTILNQGKTSAFSQNAESSFRLTKDQALERQEEERKRKENADALGIGRLLGTVLGGAASFLIPGGPIVAGLLGGIGSFAGKSIANAQAPIPVGHWNVAADKAYKSGVESNIFGSSIMDALTTGLLAKMGPDLLKELGIADFNFLGD